MLWGTLSDTPAELAGPRAGGLTDQARERPGDEGAQRALVQPSRRLVDHAGSVVRGRLGHDLPDVDPLVQRLGLPPHRNGP